MPKRWSVDLNGPRVVELEGLGNLTSYEAVEPEGAVAAAPDASGKKLVARRAQQIAMSPSKNILPTGLMLWMSGSSLHIFTILIVVGMGVVQPLRTVLGVNGAFASVDGKQVSLLQYKLLYVVMSSVLLAAGLYKCNSMGLLPVSSADWIGMIDAFRPVEHSAAAVAL